MLRFTIITRTRAAAARIASLIVLAIAFASFTVALPATPASAGGSNADCTNVLPDIAGWAWVTSPQPELVFFPIETGYPDYAIGVDVQVPTSPAPPWSGVDNPAPLLWLVAHYPDYAQVFGNLFSPCEVYSPQLISTMNADHFAPSMVGGTNPTGVTSTGAPPVVQQPNPAPSPQPSPTPKPTPSPSPQPSPQPTPPMQSQSSVTPTEPPTLLTPPPYVTAQHIAQIWSRDARLVAQSGHGIGQGNGSGSGSGSGRGKHHGRPWSDYAGIIAAILVIASAIWWRRRVARRRW